MSHYHIRIKGEFRTRGALCLTWEAAQYEANLENAINPARQAIPEACNDPCFGTRAEKKP